MIASNNHVRTEELALILSQNINVFAQATLREKTVKSGSTNAKSTIKQDSAAKTMVPVKTMETYPDLLASAPKDSTVDDVKQR